MQTKKILWATVIGTVLCALISLLYFGVKFGNITQPPIYFVTLGFSGSLSLSLLRENRIREVIYLNLLIYLLFAIIILRPRPVTALIFLLYYFAFVFSIYIYVRQYDTQVASVRLAGALILASLAGLFYMGASLIHGLFFISKFYPGFILINFPIGFLVGLGVGLGGEVSEHYLTATSSS